MKKFSSRLVVMFVAFQVSMALHLSSPFPVRPSWAVSSSVIGLALNLDKEAYDISKDRISGTLSISNDGKYTFNELIVRAYVDTQTPGGIVRNKYRQTIKNMKPGATSNVSLEGFFGEMTFPEETLPGPATIKIVAVYGEEKETIKQAIVILESSQEPPPVSGSVVAWPEDSMTTVGRFRGDGEPVPEPDNTPVRLAMAGNEYESFQVIIAVKEKEANRLTAVEMTPPALQGVQLESTISQLGFVNDEHPDVLFPLDSPEAWKDIVPGENFHLWITMHAPDNTPAGVYKGQLRLSFEKGERLLLPVEVEVWDFAVPREMHLKSYLAAEFETDDIVSRYGLPYWSPEFDSFMMNAFEKLASYRLPPSTMTPIPHRHWGTAPELTQGYRGKALRFRGDREYYEVPHSSCWGLERNPYDFEDSFTLEAWIKPDRLGRKQTILAHGPEWGGGYELSLNIKDQLVLTMENSDPATNTIRKHELVTSAALLKKWHHVAVTFNAGVAKIYIDGAVKAQQTFSFTNCKPSYEPLYIGGRGAGYLMGTVDEVRVYNRALSQQEIQASSKSSTAGSPADLIGEFPFEEYPLHVPNFGSMTDPQGLAYFEQWAQFWVDRGFGITLPQEHDIGKLQSFWDAYRPILARHGWLDRSSIKMIGDEVTDLSTSQGQENIVWGRKMREVAPDLQIHHTTGARLVDPESSGDFKAFSEYVDIWIPNIFKKYLSHSQTREFFDNEMAQGKDVNFYFKWTDLDMPYIHTRYAFWLIMQYNFGLSPYRAIFWTRPEKSNRIEKYTWPVEKGFVTSLSSEAGPGYGIFFWPGKKELLPSVRAEMYRDGVEDYEYRHKLKELRMQLEKINASGQYNELMAETDAVLVIPRQIWQDNVDVNMMPINPDPLLLRNHRQALAGQIVKLSHVLGGTDVQKPSPPPSNLRLGSVSQN